MRQLSSAWPPRHFEGGCVGTAGSPQTVTTLSSLDSLDTAELFGTHVLVCCAVMDRGR